MNPEVLAQLFHETYERLSPQYGYGTRKESGKPWASLPENNKRLMIAVFAEIQGKLQYRKRRGPKHAQ